MSNSKPTGLRRIVTGHDKNGNSIIIKDGPTPGVKTTPNRPGVVIHNMWTTTSAPSRFDEPDETASSDLPLLPAKRGTVFRIVEFPSEKQVEQVDPATARKAFKEFGADKALDKSEKSRHAFMHQTDTVDYGICLEGEITLILDDSEIVMHKGDVCIQRGTNHAWTNRSDKPGRMAFILIDGKGKRR